MFIVTSRVRATVFAALLAIVSLAVARGALAQSTLGGYDTEIDLDKKITTLEDWDRLLDLLATNAAIAREARPRFKDFSGKPLEVGWDRYVLLPDAKQKLDALHQKAKQAATARNTDALNGAIGAASPLLDDQKARAWLATRYGLMMSSLLYHEAVMEPWLARGAASDRVFADEQSHTLQRVLMTVVDEALRSPSPRETWTQKSKQSRNATWLALNEERNRLVKEQAALPNPIPVQPHVRDKACAKRTQPLPTLGDKVVLAPGFPSAATYYPPFAKEAGMEGAATVRVLVSDTGCPERAEVARTSGAAELDDGALALALDGVYVPRAREGVALPGETTFRVSFQLND